MSPTTDTRLAVFYHCAHWGETWRAIDTEIVEALDASGLLSAAGVFIRNDCRNVDLYEFPTIGMVREFAARNDHHILYLHTKGVTQPKPSIDDWRACMLYWLVERWRECVAKLDAGFEAVGINEIDTPVRHFQGNFWWARASLIRRLGPVEDVRYVPTHANMTERHKAEFWLLGKGAKAYTPYHHRINPYGACNPRANYEGKRF